MWLDHSLLSSSPRDADTPIRQYTDIPMHSFPDTSGCTRRYLHQWIQPIVSVELSGANSWAMQRPWVAIGFMTSPKWRKSTLRESTGSRPHMKATIILEESLVTKPTMATAHWFFWNLLPRKADSMPRLSASASFKHFILPVTKATWIRLRKEHWNTTKLSSEPDHQATSTFSRVRMTTSWQGPPDWLRW